MTSRLIRVAFCALAISAALALVSAPAGADVTSGGGLQLVALLPGSATFTQPVYVTAPPGDPRRVLVVQQNGVIRLLKDGALESDPFMTVPDVHNAGEQGLLSMAFAPDYASTGRFYVYYSDATSCSTGGANCDNRVDEFQRADADHGAPSTRRRVLLMGHQTYQNHNGGQLQFGPDGQLYVSTGDGGSGGDPLGNGQKRDTLLGKVLRIDPRGARDGGYAVPLDNPFVGVPGTRPEVWAYGLRNPWRLSFDRLTGDLAIGDVGQNEREEVDFQRRGQGAGANYGWNACEGDLAYPVTPGFAPCPANPVPAYAPPVLTYGRGTGGRCGASITGGYVVRDASIPSMLGRYIYADYCRDFIRSAVLGPGGAVGDGDLGLSLAGVSSFGEDALCRLYVTTVFGKAYRLEAQSPGAPGCQTAPAPPGGGPSPSTPAPTLAAPSPGPTPSTASGFFDVTAPGVSDLTLTRSRFAVSAAPTALAATPRGTVFRFTLTEAATVRVLIEARVRGRRVGRRCRSDSARLRRRARCTRYVSQGALVRSLRAGRRSIAFSGRLGRRALRPGGYRATLAATDTAGNRSSLQRVAFVIVAR